MNRIKLRGQLLAISAVLFLLPTVSRASSDGQEVEIVKMAVMIHPTGWAAALGPDGKIDPSYRRTLEELRGGVYYSDSEFHAYLERERTVNQRQRDYIRKMRSNEAMVVFPGAGEAMQEMISFCEKHLAKRCIVLRSPAPGKTATTDYRALLPANVKAELFDEIAGTLQEQGGGWQAGALKVLLYTRLAALEIQHEFTKRGLRYDPDRLEAIAFGEGFEECAISWKALLADFLHLENPIENEYDLSVSGMPLLIGAQFKERIALPQNVRLFLWSLSDGRSVGFYAASRSRFADPQFFVNVPKAILPYRLYSEVGAELWPGLANVFSFDVVKRSIQDPGTIRVPVFTGLRMYQQGAPPVGRAVYIVSSAPFDAFRDALRAAEIGE